MLRKLRETDDDVGILIVRVALGLVMFPHGAQKLLGWFGGHGFAETLQVFTSQMGLPAVVVLLLIIAEFFGSISLIGGFLGRIGAFGILCVMVGAILMVHLPHGFFMNWYGLQKGEGIEYHLLAIGMALAVLVKGSGAFSIDRSMTRNTGVYR